ncbi:MAG TPA: ABC transporter permease [Thermoanaerobaculia bacterium]
MAAPPRQRRRLAAAMELKLDPAVPFDPAKAAGAQGLLPVTVIRPSRGWASLGVRELWRYRELLGFFVWRDVKVRYKQTALGVAWAVLQPVFTMLVFSLFFGHLAGMPSDGVPYPVFSFAALVPWTFFANGVSQAANSLVGNQSLLQKVWFPRLTIPASAVLAGLVDFALAFLVLLVMMPAWGLPVPPRAALALPLLLLALVASLGAGLWLSALNVQYRDVRHAVPFLLQLWLFATPIAYPASLVPEPWRALYGINPMVGVVEGFRWALLGTGAAPGPAIAVSTLAALALLAGGALYFRRVERIFADVV